MNSLNKVSVCDWHQPRASSVWRLSDSYVFVCSFHLCKVGKRIRYIYDGQKVRKPYMRVSHLSHKWKQRWVTLLTILNKTPGQLWTNGDDRTARRLHTTCRGCILNTWFKKQKQIFDDKHYSYTVYHKSKVSGIHSASLWCSVSCLLRTPTLWSQTAIPHTGLERAARTKEQKPNTWKQTVHFFKCRRTKWNL